VALLVTTFYTFLPCFLFVFAGAPLVEKTHGKRSVEAVLRLIMAVVVAAMLELMDFLSRGVLFPTGKLCLTGLDGIALTWIGVSLLLLRVFKVNVAWVIGLSILAGLARWFIHT
jgi:chromate transporter